MEHDGTCVRYHQNVSSRAAQLTLTFGGSSSKWIDGQSDLVESTGRGEEVGVGVVMMKVTVVLTVMMQGVEVEKVMRASPLSRCTPQQKSSRRRGDDVRCGTGW